MPLVKVEPEDIEAGIPKSNPYCPIALALRKKFGGYWRVGSYFASQYAVDTGEDRPNFRNLTRMLRMSNPATQFVFDFDEHKPVRPAAFRLVDMPVFGIKDE